MAKHIWSLLCQKAVLDKYTNLVSVHDVLEGFQFSLPDKTEEGKEWIFLPQKIMVLSLVTRTDSNEPENLKLKVHVISPTGEVFEANESASEIDLAIHTRSRSFMSIPGIPFWSSGTHWYSVSLQKEDGGWDEVARIPLDINQTEPREKLK